MAKFPAPPPTNVFTELPNLCRKRSPPKVRTPLLPLVVTGKVRFPVVTLCVPLYVFAPNVAAVPAIFVGAIAADALISAFTIVPSTISGEERHGLAQFTSVAADNLGSLVNTY